MFSDPFLHSLGCMEASSMNSPQGKSNAKQASKQALKLITETTVLKVGIIYIHKKGMDGPFLGGKKMCGFHQAEPGVFRAESLYCKFWSRDGELC